MNILVTGGAGFIGTNLIKELENRGHDVHSIDLQYNLEDKENYNRCDVRNYRQLAKIFEKKEYGII